jgi:selenide,water dikinase
LNTVGTVLGEMDGVHAMTDVTGFALLGHLLEIARGSHLSAHVRFDRLPVIEEAMQLAQAGVATGAAERNWASYGHEVEVGPGIAEWQRKLLCDPQTSGGLLVACDQKMEAEILTAFRQLGFTEAVTIGRLGVGTPGVRVD